MIAKATDHEKLLQANGAGAFGKIEYLNETSIILRTGDVKTADLSGMVRVYFNAQREQVISGRRFDPMGSNLVLMRPGSFYRVYSTIEIVEPIPKGVTAVMVLEDDAADVMMITTAPLREGFTGVVSFTIQPFRRVEMEKMTSIAHLVFFEETVNLDKEWLDKLRAEVFKGSKSGASKKGNSSRSKTGAKKSGSNTKKIEKPIDSRRSKDESSVSDEYSDNPES